MTLQIKVDPGGEKWRTLALNKLQQMKEFMAAHRLPVLTRWLQPNGTDRIMLNSCLGMDRIRITAGALRYYVLVTMPDPTPYRMLFVDTISDGVGGLNELRVQLSDGTILSSQSMIPTPQGGGTGYLPFPSGAWSGGDFLDTYTRAAYEGADPVPPVVFGQQATFTTPVDVALPGLAIPPVSPYTSAADTVAFTDRWNAGYQVAVAREKARLQTNSATAIETLRSGGLTDGRIRDAVTVKVGALDSSRPRAVLPFTAVINGDDFPTMLSSLGFLTGLNFGTTPAYDIWLAAYVPGGPTTDFDATVSRSVTAQYTDMQGVLHEETISGTWRQQRTVYPSTFDSFFHSYTNTFTNYPAFDAVTGICPLDVVLSTVTLGARSVVTGPARDGSNTLGIVLNGTMIYGHAADSAYRTPSDAAGNGAGAVPPIASTIIISTLPLYLQYLRDVQPVDVNTLPDPKPAYSSNWLSTSMVDGEIVTLIPFAPVKDDENLGMFASKTGAQKIAVYGKAKFRYNLDGSFTFRSWKDAQEATDDTPAGPVIIELADDVGTIVWQVGNCLIEYTAFEWDDVKLAAETQMNQLQSPTTSLQRFIALVKSTVGL